MISVVCAYNKREVFDECLVSSLEAQSAKYELIAIDNSEGVYKSAAEAFNASGERARGKYVMFVHQDVTLTSASWLESVEPVLDGLANLGIAGVAGKSESGIGAVANITHGDPPILAGKVQIDRPKAVQTLDECLVIVPKEILSRFRLDAAVCDGWHLYWVDYCLNIGLQSLKAYVLPVHVHHKSTGLPLPAEYYSTLSKLLEKYRGEYTWIPTTCGDWSTLFPLELQFNLLWKCAVALRSLIIAYVRTGDKAI